MTAEEYRKASQQIALSQWPRRSRITFATRYHNWREMDANNETYCDGCGLSVKVPFIEARACEGSKLHRCSESATLIGSDRRKGRTPRDTFRCERGHEWSDVVA